jgi:hypothetical protein
MRHGSLKFNARAQRRPDGLIIDPPKATYSLQSRQEREILTGQNVRIASKQEIMHAEFLCRFFNRSRLPSKPGQARMLPFSPCPFADHRLREEER